VAPCLKQSVSDRPASVCMRPVLQEVVQCVVGLLLQEDGPETNSVLARGLCT